MRHLALIVAVLLAAAACKGRTPAAPPCTSGPAPAVRIAVGLPPGMGHAARASVSTTPFVDTSLIRLDASGRPSPAVAMSWERRDPRTWVFTLREGLRAQNGQPLTASRIRELLLAAGQDPFYNVFSRDLESIEAPTPATVVFRLKRPNTALFEALSRTLLTNDDRNTEWRAGPFRLVRDTPDEMTFEPFRGTWSGPPTVAGLHLRFFPSAREAWAAFLRREADVFQDVPPEAVPLLAQSEDVQLFNVGSRYVFSLLFQQRHPLLRDPRVRQAINLAIDRDAIAKRFGPYAAVSHGPFAPTYWAAQGRGQDWPYDPVAARALLKEVTGGRTQTIELECLTTSQLATYADLAAAIAAQLEQVHIRLRLVSLPVEQLYPRLSAGDFAIAATPVMTGSATQAPYLFWHSSTPMTRAHYSAADSALDALLSAASDDDERTAVRDVLDVMHTDPPAAFVVATPLMRAVRRTWRVPADDPDTRHTLPYWTLAASPPCEAAR